jgi:hypothetical protein
MDLDNETLLPKPGGDIHLIVTLIVTRANRLPAHHNKTPRPVQTPFFNTSATFRRMLMVCSTSASVWQAPM